MNQPSAHEAFWSLYLGSLPEGEAPPAASYEVWSFGDTGDLANELGELVLRGVKTATASLVWVYEAEGEDLPREGDLSLITDGDGRPLCIIQTTEIRVKLFEEVDEGFAYDEGEGDRSLAFWRQVHWKVFSRECAAIGREPSRDMPVVCERFRVLFLGPSVR